MFCANLCTKTVYCALRVLLKRGSVQFKRALPKIARMEPWLIAVYISYVLLIGIPTYLFLCADSSDTGLNGIVSRFCVIAIPTTISRGLKACLGNSGYAKLAGCYDYATNQRNPIMQIMYYLILNAAFTGWLILGLPKLPTFLVSEFHSYFAPAFVIFAQFTYYLACTVGPGTLTQDNVECFNHQPYDGMMYIPGAYCSSCKVPKV